MTRKIAGEGPNGRPPGWRPGPSCVSAVEEARHMTGTIHVADVDGDTTRTWDTTDPATVREIEEVFLEAQTAGRLVYRQAGANRLPSRLGIPSRTPSCSWLRAWLAAGT
jgi:hypothetical protein